MTEAGAFQLWSIAHLESPAGRAATSLEALRAGIEAADPEVIFHHVTRIAIRHPGARDLPPNDFARWTGTALQDQEIAERLAFAGSRPLEPLEEVRASLLGVLAKAPARRLRLEAPEEAAFHFVRSRTILAPLALAPQDPKELVEHWREVDLGAAFYHLIEAPLLGPEGDRLVPWLRACGAGSLAQAAEDLASSGRPLARLHRELGVRWRRIQIPDRLARRLETPEEARQAEARAAMARLAGRLRGAAPEKPEP